MNVAVGREEQLQFSLNITRNFVCDSSEIKAVFYPELYPLFTLFLDGDTNTASSICCRLVPFPRFPQKSNAKDIARQLCQAPCTSDASNEATQL